jgi:hypothetical protein
MTSTIVLCFIAGVLAANATPHFVKGITKEQFPTPFSAASLPNLIGGLLWLCSSRYSARSLIAGASRPECPLMTASPTSITSRSLVPWFRFRRLGSG